MTSTSPNVSPSAFNTTKDIIDLFVIPTLSRSLLSQIKSKEGTKELVRMFTQQEAVSWLSECRSHVSENVKSFAKGTKIMKSVESSKKKGSKSIHQLDIQPPNFETWIQLITLIDQVHQDSFLKHLLHVLVSIVVLYKADSRTIYETLDRDSILRSVLSKLDIDRCFLVAYSWIYSLLSVFFSPPCSSLKLSILDSIIKTCSSQLNDMSVPLLS